MQSTPTRTSNPRVIRFGIFEADLSAGELRKGGSRIRLQEQPFQILAMLLERPGQIITREELRSRLWPGDTFVDFEHGVNSAVARLRDALGDSADRPHYVETLPRRGYRLIVTVEGAPPPTPPTAPANASNTTGNGHAVAQTETVPAAPQVVALPSPATSLRRHRSLAVAILGAV